MSIPNLKKTVNPALRTAITLDPGSAYAEPTGNGAYPALIITPGTAATPGLKVIKVTNPSNGGGTNPEMDKPIFLPLPNFQIPKGSQIKKVSFQISSTGTQEDHPYVYGIRIYNISGYYPVTGKPTWDEIGNQICTSPTGAGLIEINLSTASKPIDTVSRLELRLSIKPRPGIEMSIFNINVVLV